MSSVFPYRAEFFITGDARALKTALGTLLPETGDTGRTRFELSMREEKLVMVIDALDSTALRAGVNSYLRWLNEALEIHENAKK